MEKREERGAKGHRNILQGTTCKLKFSNWIRGRWVLSYCNYQLIKFEEDERFGLLNNYEKRYKH